VAGASAISARHTKPTNRGGPTPRYIVEPTFPNGHEIPIATGGAEICRTVVQRNAEVGVAWVSVVDRYFYR
jgi:hypothetical protein